MNTLEQEFHQAFPARADTLSRNDLEMYRRIVPLWRELFRHYDIIQAYATDPILPLIAEKRPYVAFEHGTLRDFTLGNSTVCRNTALGYRLADHVFITNGDCLEYAHKLGITQFSPMLHPFNEQRIRAIEGDHAGVHQQLGATYVFLCTLRHDWAVKGTDKYIRALPGIVDALSANVRLIMTNWGSQIKESHALAEELGVAHLIEWVEPLNRHRLFRMQKSVDVLFDQIALPHFGATAPEGIAAGVPVIMSYDPRSTEWIVSDPAPILSAWTVEEIVQNVRLAVDPAWLSEYRIRARLWIDQCHSSRQVVAGHLNVYARLLRHHGNNGSSAEVSPALGSANGNTSVPHVLR